MIELNLECENEHMEHMVCIFLFFGIPGCENCLNAYVIPRHSHWIRSYCCSQYYTLSQASKVSNKQTKQEIALIA